MIHEKPTKKLIEVKIDFTIATNRTVLHYCLDDLKNDKDIFFHHVTFDEATDLWGEEEEYFPRMIKVLVMPDKKYRKEVAIRLFKPLDRDLIEIREELRKLLKSVTYELIGPTGESS